MDKKKIALVIAILELLSALPFYGIYTMVIRFYGATNYWTPLLIGTSLLGLAFLVLPLLAVIGLWKDWRSSYLWMGLYPVVAFLFGVVPVPFANYLYTDNSALNTVFIGIANLCVVILAIWLFLQTRASSNNSLRPTEGSG